MKKARRCSILVCGAGPAGSSAALAASANAFMASPNRLFMRKKTPRSYHSAGDPGIKSGEISFIFAIQGLQIP